jgi:hypothetical protein
MTSSSPASPAHSNHTISPACAQLSTTATPLDLDSLVNSTSWGVRSLSLQSVSSNVPTSARISNSTLSCQTFICYRYFFSSVHEQHRIRNSDDRRQVLFIFGLCGHPFPRTLQSDVPFELFMMYPIAAEPSAHKVLPNRHDHRTPC